MGYRPVKRWKYAGKKADPFYRGRAWKQIRIHVLQRDCYLCQVCRRRWANTVHHVLPRKDYPEKALDPDNLEAICQSCHNQEHPEKGRRGREAPTPVDEGIRIITV